jgi:hypothetical protein
MEESTCLSAACLYVCLRGQLSRIVSTEKEAKQQAAALRGCLHVYDFPYESAYDLVHLSTRKTKMTFPGKGRQNKCFPKNLIVFNLKFNTSADSYRMGNNMCSKSYADSHAKLFV